MLSPHWGNILSVLDSLLVQLKENHVPAFLVRKLFQQLFSFVNVQLFNQLLLRRECCSFSNGEYVKTGLAEVENWIHTAGKDWVGESWDELRYIRQVSLKHCLFLAMCWVVQAGLCEFWDEPLSYIRTVWLYFQHSLLGYLSYFKLPLV